VLWLWVRFLDSGGVKYGLTCNKAYSLLNHAKLTQTIEARLSLLSLSVSIPKILPY
jgi:hypothetical protein